MDLEHIQRQEAHSDYFARAQSPSYLGLCLAGEVGEVCNDVKKFERGSYSWDKLRSRLIDELPDILIYLVLLADVLEIDLDGAYIEKRKVNDARFTKAE